jgi:hypothetical protein
VENVRIEVPERELPGLPELVGDVFEHAATSARVRAISGSLIRSMYCSGGYVGLSKA